MRRILPPGATIAFVFFGMGALASDALHMDLSRRPVAVRAASNVAYVSGCIATILLVVRAMTTRQKS